MPAFPAADRSAARVSLHLGASPSADWGQVLAPWFRANAQRALESPLLPCVIVPDRSYAQQLRARLASARMSLLGIRFVVPAQLRELLRASATPRLLGRAHLRLVLAIAADQCAHQTVNHPADETLRIADAIAREPDAFLRAVEQVKGAGATYEIFGSTILSAVARRFDKLLHATGAALAPELDRSFTDVATAGTRVPAPAAASPGPHPATLVRLDGLKPSSLTNAQPQKNGFMLGQVLITGFDALHWSTWELLRKAVLSAEHATVLLQPPRDEAGEADRIWISAWEEEFGATSQVSAPGPALESEQLLLLPELHAAAPPGSASPQRCFLMTHDTTEQAAIVAAVATAFLSDKRCDRVAILLPGPGALARLVASALERLNIAHNDSIAHERRGVFDNEEWRAWTALQEQPRLTSLLRFFDHSEAMRQQIAPLSLRKLRDSLQRACGDILINAVDVLCEYCRHRSDEPNYVAAAGALQQIAFLPERASFGSLMQETLKIFQSLKWTERAAELQRVTREWADSIAGVEISRRDFLRWLNDVFAESSRTRRPLGDNPYARVQLVRYDQAENETWSHVILAGLNEGAWPPPESESPFLPDEILETLNRTNKQRSRFGEGQDVMKPGTVLCLTSRDRRALALRQFLNVIESTPAGVAAVADLYAYAPREQASNASELFARLYFDGTGEVLSQQAIGAIHHQTRSWIETHDFVQWNGDRAVDVGPMVTAYEARRSDKSFGEFEFSFRVGSPPPDPISMSATDIGNALKRPALVWLKTFLRVEVDDFDSGSWSLATGQWVHRWLATIGAVPRDNRFVARPGDAELVRQVTTAARGFRDEIASILQECDRRLPDWWTSGWHNARFLAEQFASQLAVIKDWPRLATEWKLESPQRIPLSHDEELCVRGRVDLLMARGEPIEELWIVDYKTGEARPLAGQPAKLQKQLAAGDGIQICIYALALRPICRTIWTSLLARDSALEKQSSVADLVAQEKLLTEIARMQRTGIFGMLGELRSEFSFTGTYPLATLPIDKFLLKRKWEKTHPAFAAAEEE